MSSTDDCVFLGTASDSTETIQLPNKIPPYSAHSSARRVQSIIGSRLPCGGQAPFRPIWLCGTGFHRLCLYLYLHPFPRVMHRFSVEVCCLRRYAKGAYRTSLHGRTKSPASALSGLSYLKCTPLQAALSTVFPVKGGNSRSAQAAMNKVYKNFVFSPFNLLLDGIYFPHHRKG